MTIFNVFTLMGGIAMFLYGMDLMGKALEQTAGSKLQGILSTMTSSPLRGLLLGMAVTAVIQSSGATTVMAVGFVNSGLMELHQAISVIMGANVGTTVTGWLLSLSGLEGDSFITQMMNPNAWSPILGFIGIWMYMIGKDRKRGVGKIMLGFAILMAGMNTMSHAMSPLADEPWFMELFLSFKNPILGVIAGAVLTAVLQSSSASVGILQALTSTGAVTYSAAVPIIMGQNIGTTVTALISSAGANKNAKRTAFVHLYFNLIGTIIFLCGFYGLNALIGFSFFADTANTFGIAIVHTVFNVVTTAILLPFNRVLEKLAILTVPDSPADKKQENTLLDDRLLTSPGLAIQHCRDAVLQMGKLARKNFSASVRQLEQYNHKEAEKIREREDTIDRLEDRLGNYMLKIPQDNLSEQSSATISALLHILSEFERIGDYSINLVEFAENMESTGAEFSPQAQFELTTIGEAVKEAIDMALGCFEKQDLALAETIEPREEGVDQMQETLKDRHINRLRNGQCTVDAAFPFVESLSCLERISDHCSNIGVYMISYVRGSDEVDHHTYIMQLHSGQVGHYNEQFRRYTEKYYDQIRSAKA